MAWKKIVVSGSAAELSNVNISNAVTASGYSGDGSGLTNLTIAQVATITDTFTAQTSVATTHNFDTKNVQVQVYNDSDQLIIPATVTTTDANTVTTTFDSSTSGRVVVAKGGHIVSGSTEFANIANKPTLVSSSAQLAADISGSSTSLSSSLASRIDNITSTFDIAADSGTNDTVTTGETLTFTGNSVVTTTVSDNTITFGTNADIVSSSAQLAADISGSFTATSASLATRITTAETELENTILSASAEGSAQGTIAFNGVDVDVNGMQTDDSPTFAGLTVTGNLNVTGDTIQAQVTNLNVEDKFILLNSGSATGDAGIVFGGAGGATPNTGDGIFYDDSDSVFAFGEDIASNATTATNSSKLGNIQTAAGTPSGAPTFQGTGTVHVNTSDEGIWIYS
jgi:Ni,Fe-hydrogenase III small subunit